MSECRRNQSYWFSPTIVLAIKHQLDKVAEVFTQSIGADIEQSGSK